MRSKFWIVGSLVLISLIGFYLVKKEAKYIFINETGDHQFDESIRMSIMAAHKRTGIQNAVVITNQTHVDATQLFKDLSVGRTNKGKGILYVYSPVRKTLEIEVGYVLEGVLPDVVVKRLELAAKSFIYSQHYQDFWAELINTLNIEIANGEVDDFDFSNLKYVSGGAGVKSRSYQETMEQFKEESHTAVDHIHFAAQDTVDEALQTYLLSLRKGAGEVGLDILTPESRLRRTIVPTTNYQLYRNHRMYQRAGVDRIFEIENLAFVFFRPNHPVLPLILRRDGEKWRVHEPLSWSLFHRFEDSMKVFLKYPIEGPENFRTYVSQNLGQPLYRKPQVQPSILARPISPRPKVDEFYFKLFWLHPVIDGLKNQSDEESLWILSDAYQNLGQFTPFLTTYKKLARILPTDEVVQKNYRFYTDRISFDDGEWKLTR